MKLIFYLVSSSIPLAAILDRTSIYRNLNLA